MNWITSSAARAGLGPPEWIVIVLILALIFVAGLESDAGPSDYRGAVLTKRDKYVLAVGLGLLGLLIAFLASQNFR